MDQLLVSGQLDREDIRVSRQIVDLCGLCRSVVGSVAVRKPDAIELQVDCVDDSVRVDANPDRLRQVVANLVDNAVKYSPGGGRVDVRVLARSGSGLASTSAASSSS